MNLVRIVIRKFFITTIALVQVLGVATVSFPRVAVAQEAPPPPTCPVVNGTLEPTGASAHTFTFRPADGEAPTCVWENAYYYWDPVSKAYTAKYDTYVCDPATLVCENVEWVFVTSDNQYVERRTVVSVPATGGSDTEGSSTTDGNGAQSQTNGTSIVSGNGTGSSNAVSGSSDTNLDIDLVNNLSVLMALDSYANSGDATALFNTTVGDVSTGDATTMANILNMIQSSWNPANGDINLFTASLYNDFFGDILFDPSIFLGNGTDSSNLILDDSNLDLTLNVENDASIQNDINLNSQSGDATANGNTTVGDVSTGDAAAVANVINMINSMITSGSSFIGSINLHGDLNGDILLPQSVMDILLGNGTGSSNSITGNQSTDIDADINTNSTITNNTNLTANTGDATANANTTVGNISTGDASTNVEQMNLVGQNLQGSGGLLVFVNVMGSWVGMLFDSPGTSTIMGGNGTNSTNTISGNTNTDADINVNNNYGIVNNLNLNATSGNATANANTTVGNVSTGNASSAVNLLNMIDSQIEMSDWFGVLFINVFGEWDGSFGVNTNSGNQPPVVVATNTGVTGSSGGTGSSSPATGSTGQTIRFKPNTSTNQSDTEGQTLEVTTSAAPSSGGNTGSSAQAGDSSTSTAKNGSSMWLVSGITIFAGLLLLGSDRLFALIRKPQV